MLAYAAARHLYGGSPMPDITKELSLPEPVELSEAELDHVCGGAVSLTDSGGTPAPEIISVITDPDAPLRQTIYLEQRFGSGSGVRVRRAV